MKRNKFVIAIAIILFLFSILIALGIETQANIREEETKEKLKQAVNNSYTNDLLDIEKLKDNIEKLFENSKIMNKESKEFPVHATVNGDEYKIEENGNIGNVNKIDNNNQNNQRNVDKINNNQINNNVQTNNTENKVEDNSDNTIENPVKEENNIIVKYQDDEKEAFGIKISTTKDGLVTINGKSLDKLFIKISNNIQISNNAKDFEKWKQEDGIIIEKGKPIKENVTILNNTVNKGQVNVVLRTEENEAIGILKLVDNETEYKDIQNKNIIANYIYIDKNVEINDMRFIVKIIEETENKTKI